MKHVLLSVAVVAMVGLFVAVGFSETAWKAGVARSVITPQEPVWQLGFLDRKEPVSAVLSDLWAKALAVEDADGNRALIITLDLLGLPRDVSDAVKEAIAAKHSLAKSQILLSASHTHSGPAISLGPFALMPEGDPRLPAVESYTRWFVETVAALADEAFATLAPVEIATGNGLSRMQVNRRDDKRNGPLDLPVGAHDYSVPVMRVTAAEGTLLAVLFGYACHPTTLNRLDFSGDWCGFAQEELEKRHPGTVAMFVQGACGDISVFPRGEVNFSRHIGEGIAVVVDCMLGESLTVQPANLSVAYAEIELPYGWQPGPVELTAFEMADHPILQAYAAHLRKEIATDGALKKSYPCYPVQVWKIGAQPLVALGGEVLIGYSIHLKKLFGEEAFCVGYANDVMGYIPTARVLREGGYEAVESQIGYGRSGRWSPEIEKLIIGTAAQLGGEIGLTSVLDRVEWTE